MELKTGRDALCRLGCGIAVLCCDVPRWYDAVLSAVRVAPSGAVTPSAPFRAGRQLSPRLLAFSLESPEEGLVRTLHSLVRALHSLVCACIRLYCAILLCGGAVEGLLGPQDVGRGHILRPAIRILGSPQRPP